MSLASLDVSLTLGLARFEADSRRAESRAYLLGQNIGKGILVAAEAAASFTALAGTAAVGVLAWADRNIEATAKLHGLAEETGIAASALQSFRTASDTSGLSLDAVAKLSERLSTTLSKPIDPTRGAGAALAAIGLSANELRARKPDEQLELIAQKLAGFAEGAGRTAVAVTLLGKSGAAALPFLNDLAESGRSQIKLTDEQIDAADRYSKASARTRSELGQLAQAAALQALPAMNAFTEALRDTAQAVVGVDASTKILGTSTAVATFSENAVLALGHVVDAGDGAVRVFGLVGKVVGGYAAVAGALLRGEVQQAKDIGAEFRADAAALLDAPIFSDRLAARLAASKIPAAADPAKPVLNFRIPDALKATKAATESTRAYDSLVKSIQEKTAVDQAELDGVAKLTEGQRLQAKVFADIDGGFVKLTLDQKLNVDGLLQQLLAVENLNEAKRAELAWMKESAAENVKTIEGLLSQRGALEATAQASRDQLALFGLTRDQVEKLATARLRDAAATLEQRAAQAENAYLVEATMLYWDQAAALRETADAQDALAAKVAQRHDDPLTGLNDAVRDYLDGIKRAGDDTNRAIANSLKSLEDAGVSVLTGGNLRTAAKSLVDSLINEFVRLKVVRPLMADIFGSGTSTASAGGWLASLFGSGGSDAAVSSGAALTANGFAGFAKGDVFNSPTAFRFAKGSGFANGVMGEAGPEAVMPLRRGADGKLGVASAGGSNQNVYHINVTTQAAPNMSRDTALQQGATIGAGIQRAMRRNG